MITGIRPPILGEVPAIGGGKRPALFLDRDGVINLDHGYVHCQEDTEWIPGIFDLVSSARKHGYLPVVVTNQAGIARGIYTEEAFMAFTRWMHAQFLLHDAPLAATYYCPHHPTAGLGFYGGPCQCRKPAPGMILAAAELFGLDLSRSVLVGDKESDLEAGRAAGLTQLVKVESKCILPSDLMSLLRSCEE